MIFRVRASIALAASALLLPGCLEADVQADVKADGSGTLGMGMKFSEKFVEVVKKMEKLDPKQDVVKQAREGMMKKPDDAMLAAWEKAGLKVVQFEAVADEKRISSTMKLEFRTLDALKNLEQNQAKKGSGPTGDFTLTKDDKGVYTLAMGTPESMNAKGGPIEIEEDGEEDDEDEDGGMEEKGGDKKGGKEEPKEAPLDPEAEAKKVGEAMAMMGELMGEVQNFKFTISMKVPGEVVDFHPATAATKEGTTVTWKFDFAAMMQAQMAGGMDENAGMENFKVRFKMPEGQSIPEAALTKPAAAKTPSAEKPAEAPKAPAPAPGGGK